MQFTKAKKEQLKLRMALVGPAGSGKTYSALRIAKGLGKRIAVVDTEHKSASLYADEFDFDTLHLTSYHPQQYIDAIKTAANAGYDVLIIDSLSHAWMGKDGALELVDRASVKSKGNSYVAWRDVTPLHNKLVDAMLGAPLHLFVTMRSKTEYVQEKDDKTGKTTVRKVGLQAIQRDGLEYEFTVVGDIDIENHLSITKTRCKALNGAVIHQPGEELAATLSDWLNSGEPRPRATDEQVAQLQDFAAVEWEDSRLARRIASLLKDHAAGNLTPDAAEKAITALTATMKNQPQQQAEKSA